MHAQKQHADKLYEQLYVASMDLGFAKYCLDVIIKKRWHNQPWEKRGTIYLQQSVYTTALIVSYARPFTKNKELKTLPNELKQFDPEETKLHEHIIRLRHEVYAHSDSKKYSITPWTAGNFSTDIVSAPSLRFTVDEAALLKQMIRKLITKVREKMEELAPLRFLPPPSHKL